MLDIAHALPAARTEIVDFMQAAFPRAKWDRSGWQALLAHRWGGADDSYAITVRDGGALVGVLGLVSATRATAVGPAKTRNMTSWYVHKDYRGQGVGSRMLDLVTADAHITVTNFSSARAAVPVVERSGFTALDRTRLVWHPACVAQKIKVHDDPLALGDALPQRDRDVIRDHAGLGLRMVAVQTPDGLCTVVASVKQKHDAYVTFETMYLGNNLAFSRHARAIAGAILPPSGAVLSVDSRFVTDDAVPDSVEEIAVPRLYHGARMAPADVDHLYSEIVLLGMKMY